MPKNTHMIRLNHRGPVTVLNIHGDITADSLPALTDAYAEAREAETSKILIDIDREAYINSGGIAVLIQLLAQTRQKGQEVAITGISDHFKKIFKMVGITRFATLFDSAEDAMKSFS